VATAAILARPEGRVQPQDLEAETSVLGAILLDQAAITRVLDFLSPEDFYRENNAQIYRAALNLFREGEPIDNVTLASELEKLGVLERIGGRAHLALIQEAVPTAANVEHYARIVKDKAYKRRLISAGSQVTALGFDDSLDAEEAVNQAQAHVYAISDDKVGSGMERIYDLLKPAMDRIDAQMASGGGVIGIPSGFHDIDRMTNGFKQSDLIVIAGRPSMGKCLTAGTLIDDPRTGERLTIEEAVRRQLPCVMGLSEAGSVRPAAVASWVDSGIQPCFRVVTRTGRFVEVTGHHPFRTVSGWRPLHDLVVGEKVAVPRVLPCFGTDETLGLDRVRRLARLVAEGGLEDSSPHQRFPDCAWRWDRARLAEFVKVLMTCDSTLDAAEGHPRIKFAVASRALAEDTRHALTRLGVVATLWREREGYWRVDITDPASVATFRREVGWTSATEDKARRGNVQILSTPDLYWDEIISIEPIGSQRVYDLTVPDGANFIAQDVVVHNTSFVLNVALHAAIDHKKPVAIFSLEMSKEQLVERMLCEQARIDAQRLHRGTLSDIEYERLAGALGPLGDAPIFIDDAPALDDLTMRLKARQARSREGIELLIVDYLQLMHGHSRRDDSNRVQEVSAISRALKSIARELRIPVIACSQLSRAPEARPDKRPILSDLRESGCVAGDTPVFLPDVGVQRPIRELVGMTGFRVLALNTATWHLESRQVTNSFATGQKPVFRLTTRGGRSIRATANHRFLAAGGWARLDELDVGQRLAVVAQSAMAPAGVTGRATRSAIGAQPLWDDVVSIEPDGQEEVYDLTVDDLHNFCAADTVLHNSIEQDSDLVMFLYRDEYYNRDKTEKPGIAEVILAKHRNGPTGMVELVFRKELTRFENLERRRPEAGAVV
jgi:replicative DNA helicase